jgi:hypothetical protein
MEVKKDLATNKEHLQCHQPSVEVLQHALTKQEYCSYHSPNNVA